MTFIRKEGPPTKKARRDWLKGRFGLGTNCAWWLAEHADGRGWPTVEAGRTTIHRPT